MSDPEQAGPRKAPSYPDHGSEPEPAAPMQSSPSAYQGGGVTWATSAISLANKTPGSSGLGERSPPAPSRETSCHRGGAPLGVTQKGLGARLPVTGRPLRRLPQPPRLGSREHACSPRPGRLGGRGGGQGRSQAGAGLASTTSFVPGDVPKLCCPARKPPAFESVWLLRLKQIKRKHS